MAADGTFWDHLDALRGVLVRGVLCVAALAAVCFCFKETLFEIVLAPSRSDFVLYRLLARFGPVDGFRVELINTGLARPFILHVEAALTAGLVLASPYLLFEGFRFVLPALYAAERRCALGVAAGGYALFLTGAALSYFLIFPLAFRFLGTYSVSAEVTNLISLDSYVSTLLTLSLCMGLAFELPLLCWAAARLGLLDAARMRAVRRHALVGIFFAAAVITPTSDVFTLCLTALPIVLLYEAGILVVARTRRGGR